MAAIPGGDGSVSLPFLFMRLSLACYSNINNQAKRNDVDFSSRSLSSPKVSPPFVSAQVTNELLWSNAAAAAAALM